MVRAMGRNNSPSIRVSVNSGRNATMMSETEMKTGRCMSRAAPRMMASVPRASCRPDSPKPAGEVLGHDDRPVHDDPEINRPDREQADGNVCQVQQHQGEQQRKGDRHRHQQSHRRPAEEKDEHDAPPA